MPRVLHLWHLASLDAPTVAVVWTMGFADVAGVQLKLWVLLLIACGTWTVYVGDRLLDARRAISSGKLGTLRERHFFHWRHRRLLIPGACVTATIAAALIVSRMPSAARHRDSVLAAAALMYFSGVHSATSVPHWIRKRVSKEFMVGVLFTAGCAAPTLSRIHSLCEPLIACLTMFAVLAWFNCSAIEKWESSAPPTAMPLRTIALGTACLAAAGILSVLDVHASVLAAAAGVSALLLALLDRTRGRLSPLTLRTLADMVLLTPVILMAMGKGQG
jgi:hypothetical protein